MKNIGKKIAQFFKDLIKPEEPKLYTAIWRDPYYNGFADELEVYRDDSVAARHTEIDR